MKLRRFENFKIEASRVFMIKAGHSNDSHIQFRKLGDDHSTYKNNNNISRTDYDWQGDRP